MEKGNPIFRFLPLPALILVTLSVGLVFIATMNAYYVSGDFQDIAWNTTVAWRNTLGLYGPPAFPYSFLNVHMSLIFWLTNAVSYLLPFSKIDFFGLVCGGIYALFALGVRRAWFLRAPLLWSWKRDFGASLLALAVTFSAIGLQALRLPHIEMAMPALGLWFFLSLAENKMRRAAVFFVLCLMVREDAGFHLFALLFLWLALQKVTQPRERVPRPLVAFCVTGFLYALVVLLVKDLFFLDADNMSTIYTGSPAWAHVTWDLWWARWSAFGADRSFLYMPFLAVLLWAAVVRRPMLVLGYIAFLPWLVFNLIAFRPSPGTMSLYYPFPFWLALAWPLLADLLDKRKPKRHFAPYFFLVFFSLVGVQKGSLVFYPVEKLEFDTHPFALTEAWRSEEPVAKFRSYFEKNQAAFANAALDMPVASVVMDQNKGVLWIRDWNARHPTTLPDMLFYFKGAYQWHVWVKPTLAAYPDYYPYFYDLEGTKIRVASHAPLEQYLPDPALFHKIEP